MSNEIVVSPTPQTVASHRAQELVEEYKLGQKPLPSLLRGLPANVRAEVKAIIERSGLEVKTIAELRRARTTELMLHDDPDVVAKGVALSQKEDGVGNAPTQVNNFQFNHWSQEPPDGGKLLAEEKVVDVTPTAIE